MDPRNLGAILRSCAFLGASGVLVSSKNSAPPSPIVNKASAGMLEFLLYERRISSTANMARSLEHHKGSGWLVLGTSATSPKGAPTTIRPLAELRAMLRTDARDVVVVVGSEGEGIRTNVLRVCEALVHIEPLPLFADPFMSDIVRNASLNVSVSTALLLHEIVGATPRTPHEQ